MLFLISALALTQWSQVLLFYTYAVHLSNVLILLKWFIYPYNSILHVTFGVAFVALILKPFMSAELQVELNLSPFITATLLAVLHLVF